MTGDGYTSFTPSDEPTSTAIEALQRLDKDLKRAARELTASEVRYLVKLYYDTQDQRIRAAAQKRASIEKQEPNALIQWMFDNYDTLESDIERAMGEYTMSRPDGAWARGVMGIGPVLAAGLLAFIDLDRATNPAKVWAYAGVNPNQVWLGNAKATQMVATLTADVSAPRNVSRFSYETVAAIAPLVGRNPNSLWNLATLKQRNAAKEPDIEIDSVPKADLIGALAKRPWNATLKVMVWKVGQSFVKSSNREGSFYGPLYKERKAYELRNNNMEPVPGSDPVTYRPIVPGQPGMYAEQAAQILATRNFGDDTIAKRWYEQGMLPPGHIQQRAERWVAKLFISHLWMVMYHTRYGTLPPDPYAIAHLGHSTRIPVPDYVFN